MSTRYGVRRSEVIKWPTWANMSKIPFEKGLITVVKEGKLRLVFLVPAVAVAYRSCPSATPLSPYHWHPRCPLWSYVCWLAGDRGGSSTASHHSIAQDEGDRAIGRSLTVKNSGTGGSRALHVFLRQRLTAPRPKSPSHKACDLTSQSHRKPWGR